MTKQIYQVDPWTVDTGNSISARDIRQQAARLAAEGQIEPIEVVPATTVPFSGIHYALRPDGWVYAGAQVAAARELKWLTILVTYLTRSATRSQRWPGAVQSGAGYRPFMMTEPAQ